jgi:ADP-glucose pyrophosphorylase
VVAEGCIINGAKIEHSVIGIRNRIGYGTTISDSYLMGNDFYQNLEEIRSNSHNNILNIGIGERCEINNTIIDKNCRIGNDVKLIGGKTPDGYKYSIVHDKRWNYCCEKRGDNPKWICAGIAVEIETLDRS